MEKHLHTAVCGFFAPSRELCLPLTAITLLWALIIELVASRRELVPCVSVNEYKYDCITCGTDAILHWALGRQLICQPVHRRAWISEIHQRSNSISKENTFFAILRHLNGMVAVVWRELFQSREPGCSFSASFTGGIFLPAIYSPGGM